MNSTAVKAFLRGAMAESPTDEQIEELIEYLKGHIKVSKVTRDVFDGIKEEQEQQENGLRFSTAEVVKQFFYDMDWHPDYYEEYGTEAVWGINWQWIYEELKK